jgi:hypothetical protein
MTDTIEISPIPDELTLGEICNFLMVESNEIKDLQLEKDRAVVTFYTQARAQAALYKTGMPIRGVNVKIVLINEHGRAEEEKVLKDYTILPGLDEKLQEAMGSVASHREKALDRMHRTATSARRRLDESDPFGKSIEYSGVLSLLTLIVLTISVIFD